MSVMTVPSLQSGERSLPSELRTGRGRNFAARRLANGMRGVSGWGMAGLGQDDSIDDGGLTDLGTSSGGDTIVPSALEQDTGLDLGGTIPMNSQTGDLSPSLAAEIQGYTVSVPTGYTGQLVYPVGAATPAAPPGYQWATLANSAGNTLAKVLAISQGGTAITLPNGNQILTGSAGASASSALLGTSVSSFLPWVLLAGGAFLLFKMVGNR
jgi:hypothetical protein